MFSKNFLSDILKVSGRSSALVRLIPMGQKRAVNAMYQKEKEDQGFAVHFLEF